MHLQREFKDCMKLAYPGGPATEEQLIDLVKCFAAGFLSAHNTLRIRTHPLDLMLLRAMSHSDWKPDKSWHWWK